MARTTPDKNAAPDETANTAPPEDPSLVTSGRPSPDAPPKRERKPRSANVAKSDGLSPDDLRAFETYLTADIDTQKATATDDALEALFLSRKKVRALIAAAGGAA